jgi:hypothetical protein
MQKNYNLVKAMALLLLLFIHNSLQAQNCCAECQADVKMVSDKQVLLEKIEIKEGTTTKLNTNLYVSYRSGNAQKFWANLAIATAGVAVSTQLQSNPSVEGNNLKNISPLIPLGVSVATLPSIWKNRPRGVPQAGLWLQHRDTRGRLTDTWQQPISSEAKNSGELLSVNIDKPLSAGTVEVYLQNGSKNPVYYWGLNTIKNTVNLIKGNVGIVATKPNKSARTAGCPDGYLPNGQGMCCRPGTNDCVIEDEGVTPPSVPQGCPSGYLPNGQGMCCQPGTNNCVVEGSGSPTTNSTSGVGSEGCSVDVYYRDYNRATAISGARSGETNGLTSSQDLLDAGYTLLYSIPFDCETGRTFNSEVQGIPDGTNAYDAYQEFLRRTLEYNNQHQGGTGGNGGTGGGGNPDGPAKIDPPGGDNCPSGYLPDGQGMCCNPFTGHCTNGGGGNDGGNTGSGNSSPSDIDRMDRRADVDNLCNGLKRLWNNSFRNNNPVLTKEMGGYLTSTGEIILLPSYNNTPTTTQFNTSSFDQQGREIVYAYTQQGQAKVDVTIYDIFGRGVTTTYTITATIHTHPYTDGSHDTYNPSIPDINNLASDTSLKHYILAGNQLIEYNQGGKINTTIPCP